MASSILSSLLSKPRFIIANAETGAAVMTGVKVKKIAIQMASFIPRHMREDGATIADTRVIRPTIIAAEIICPTIDDANDVIATMNDRENLYKITTKGLVFGNMMMQTSALKQTAEMLSAAPFQVIFKELLQENVNPVICAQGGDSDMQDSGIQLVKSISDGVGNLVTSVTNNFNSAINSLSNLFGG